MYKKVPGKKLVEGDWLVKPVRIGKIIIKPHFEGLTKKQVTLLQNKKEVLIKDGIPFVPAFLLAFLTYNFFRTTLLLILP